MMTHHHHIIRKITCVWCENIHYKINLNLSSYKVRITRKINILNTNNRLWIKSCFQPTNVLYLPLNIVYVYHNHPCNIIIIKGTYKKNPKYIYNKNRFNTNTQHMKLAKINASMRSFIVCVRLYEGTFSRTIAPFIFFRICNIHTAT